METLLQLIQPLIELYAPTVPFIVKFIVTVGALRFFVKPIMALVEAYINFTPSTKDNEWFASFSDSKIFKAVVFALDWFGSIKIKK